MVFTNDNVATLVPVSLFGNDVHSINAHIQSEGSNDNLMIPIIIKNDGGDCSTDDNNDNWVHKVH